MVLTRKIQLFIHSNDDEEIKAHYQTLYRWRYIVFRGLNMVTSHLFVQEQLKDFFYFTENFHLKLADQAKGEEGVLNMSKLGTTDRLLCRIFKGEIPTDILGCLNHSLSSSFNKEIKDYRNGDKSLRSYKRTQPLPIRGRSIKQLKPEGHEFTFTLFKIPFRTYLGKDRDKRQMLNQICGGKIKLCASNITLEKGKIFLLATIDMGVEPSILDEHVIAEASLSMHHPITVTINKQHYLIGNKEEFLHRRLAIQAAQLRAQKGSVFNKGGHGYQRKMKAVEAYNGKEKSYIEQKLHVYSRRLIDICINRRAATLILTNQLGKEQIAKADEFLLQNWSYFSLKEKIMYKAKLVGITVVVE